GSMAQARLRSVLAARASRRRLPTLRGGWRGARTAEAAPRWSEAAGQGLRREYSAGGRRSSARRRLAAARREPARSARSIGPRAEAAGGGASTRRRPARSTAAAAAHPMAQAEYLR